MLLYSSFGDVGIVTLGRLLNVTLPLFRSAITASRPKMVKKWNKIITIKFWLELIF